MAKQVINVGTTAGDGRGDPLRDAMIKINANFTELYEGIVVQTIVGENGTTLVDISANSVNANALTGTVPAGVATWDNLGGKPTSVAASGILDLYNIAQTDAQIASEIDDLKVELGSGGAGAIDASVLTGSLPAIDGSALTGITAGVASSLDGDMTGSVFADDSTLLVDGVSGTIPAANLTGALPAIDGSALTGVLTSGGDFEGNLSGSVFADDSTILIDGTTGQIVGPVTTSTLTLNSENVTLGNGSSAGTEAVSIGKGTNAGNYAVAIGNNAGNTTQDQGAVAIGSEAGETNQGPRAIAIGNYAGETDQDYSAVAIGYEAGETSQGGKAIAIGQFAGQTNQAQGNVAIGSGAGNTDQGSVAVAIGEAAGGTNQSASAVAIGQNAGSAGQGEWAVAIGRSAGKVNQADNSIVINASGGDLNNTTPNSFVVKPIRNAQGVTTLMYNETTGEVTHSTSADLLSGSSQSIDVVAADSTLLVDSSNGTLTSSALTKPIELDDSEEVRFGTDNDMQIYHSGVTGVIKNTTGTLVLQGGTVRIQDGGLAQSAFSAANGIATLYHLNTAVLNTTAGGIQIEQGVEEKFATLTGSTGVVAHDCDNGHVFYHTGAAGDITANFTNLDLTAEYGTNLTVIINQGATPYEVTAVQIGGAAQTINWQGGSAPTGNANGIDSFSFTILNDGGTYVVLGQMVDFT